jgi:predicted component of type VI protein secretion system
LHARLIRLAAGHYQLRDQGSVAGTWVNYQQVPEEGQILKHGDLIHIGRSAFRFRLAEAPPEPEIRLRPTGPQATITPDRSENNSESDR